VNTPLITSPTAAADWIAYDPQHRELVLRDASAAYGACLRAGSLTAWTILREWHNRPEWWPVTMPAAPCQMEWRQKYESLEPATRPFAWDKDAAGCRCIWNGWSITGDLGNEERDPVIYLDTGDGITARVFDWLNVSTVDELAALAGEMAIAAWVRRSK